MTPALFTPLTEAEFQRLTPPEREDYMARLKQDLEDKMQAAERARQAGKKTPN